MSVPGQMTSRKELDPGFYDIMSFLEYLSYSIFLCFRFHLSCIHDHIFLNRQNYYVRTVISPHMWLFLRYKDSCPIPYDIS